MTSHFLSLNKCVSIREKMEMWYTTKHRGLIGSVQGETPEIVTLARTVCWADSGIVYEADERHAEELMKAL